jgi:putative glutathione S-transferase
MPGQLINGTWKTKNDFADEDGQFKRQDSAFRNWLTADGEAGPDGQKGFPAESGRYHLYVSLACPWAHRTLIFRHLKDLENHIDVSVVHPHMLDHGWELKDDFPGATGDPLYNFDYMHQLYTKAKSDYTGKVTVPVLWDKQEETIVNNESAEIIRMFNTAFNDITGNTDDYYPADLKQQIDKINDRVYKTVNNGVYKAGFATEQGTYEKAATALFDSLDWLEDLLSSKGPYLCGDRLTEADIRLLTTLLRFDAVYHTHFKCNLHQIMDYPALQSYLECLYDMPAVKPTVNMTHIKQHYYSSHPAVNPHGIVPIGPDLPWYDDSCEG